MDFDPIDYYVAAGCLLAFALLLQWGTSPFSDTNAKEYEVKRVRRTFGTLFMIAAALATSIAVISQVAQANP